MIPPRHQGPPPIKKAYSSNSQDLHHAPDGGYNIDDEATRTDMPAFDFLEEHTEQAIEEPQQVQPDNARQVPVNHSGEKTLMTDSPLLHAIEEAAGERKVVRHRSWPIIVVVILICCIVLIAFLKIIVFSSDSPPPSSESAQQTTPKDAPKLLPIARSFVDLELNPKSARVFINGHHDSLFLGGHAISFAKQSANVLNIYNSNYLPIHAYFPENEPPKNETLFELKSDELYKKSEVTLIPPKSKEPSTLRGTLNAEPISLRGSGVFTMASGLPQHIRIEQEGFGTHLHVFWPRKTLNESITLPSLLANQENEALCLVSFALPQELLKDPQLRVNFSSKSVQHNSTGSFRFPKNEIVLLEAIHPDYEDFHYALDPSTLGSATINAVMLPKDTQDNIISLSNKSSPKVTLCFRRLATTHCLRANESIPLASGRWEILVYSGEEGSKSFFSAQPFIDFKPNHHYTLQLTTKADAYTLKDLKAIRQKDKK